MNRFKQALAAFAFALAILPAHAQGTSYQGLWWKSPPPPAQGSENGWGLNIAHQGNLLFVTWFTYGADGTGTWLAGVLERAGTTGATYSGTLYVNHAAAFNTAPWPASTHVALSGGRASITFTDAGNGTFSYTYDYTTSETMDDGVGYGTGYVTVTNHSVSQVKAITRQVFASPAPQCSFTATRTAPFNYSDLWWKPDESGWGINLTHQGNVIFATWFTYGADGNPMWLAGILSPTGTAGQYSGDPLSTTRASPLFQEPWDGSAFVASRVGSATLTFTDASHASFAYTVNGIAQTKAIERQVFATPASVCN